MYSPPLTSIIAPVTSEARLDNRNRMAPAHASSGGIRFSGLRDAMSSYTSCSVIPFSSAVIVR